MKGGKRLTLLSGLGGCVGKGPEVQGDIGLRKKLKGITNLNFYIKINHVDFEFLKTP